MGNRGRLRRIGDPFGRQQASHHVLLDAGRKQSEIVQQGHGDGVQEAVRSIRNEERTAEL